MQNLRGMLTTLDPSVEESVKIISYFDALISEKVGTDGLLRGAALLAGCPAAAATGSPPVGRRMDVSGTPMSVDPNSHHHWPSVHATDAQVIVWLEREGPAHVNDEMVLERLALAMGITVERSARNVPRPALEVLLDPFSTCEAKEAMAGILGLSPTRETRVVATPAALTPTVTHHSATLLTESGLLRAAIYHGQSLTGQAGLGLATSVLELASSWKSAITALKLTTATRPVIDAADLGILVQLGTLNPDDPDVVALNDVNDTSPWAVETLEALATTGSVRAAAAVLNRHHSTVHARIDSLSSALGFDVQSPLGRTRIFTTLALWRIRQARF